MEYDYNNQECCALLNGIHVENTIGAEVKTIRPPPLLLICPPSFSEKEPATYAAAATICEYQDYLNLKLTGRRVASANNASVRWRARAKEKSRSGSRGGSGCCW